jgi:hypothetical protein
MKTTFLAVSDHHVTVMQAFFLLCAELMSVIGSSTLQYTNEKHQNIT